MNINSVDQRIEALSNLPITSALRNAGESLVEALPSIRQTTAGVLAGIGITLLGSESGKVKDTAHRKAMANRLDNLMEKAGLEAGDYGAVAQAFNKQNPATIIDLSEPEIIKEQLVTALTQSATAPTLKQAIHQAHLQTVLQKPVQEKQPEPTIATEKISIPKAVKSGQQTVLAQPIAEVFGKESLEQLTIRDLKKIPAAINEVIENEGQKISSKIDGKRHSNMTKSELVPVLENHLRTYPELIPAVTDKLQAKQQKNQQKSSKLRTEKQPDFPSTTEAVTSITTHNINVTMAQTLLNAQQQNG